MAQEVGWRDESSAAQFIRKCRRLGCIEGDGSEDSGWAMVVMELGAGGADAGESVDVVEVKLAACQGPGGSVGQV